MEGPSDATALERYFIRYFDNDRIVTKIIYGDMTTQKGLGATNIKAHIGKCIKNWMDKDKFRKQDIKEIIHIVDMDGAYIDDGAIKYNTCVSKIRYTNYQIETHNIDNICRRNQQKREILNTLSTISHDVGIYKGIPYGVYYMSCNLDHVLYDLQNATDKEKEDRSMEFADQYIDNIDDFIYFLCKSSFSKCDNYKDSWDFIKQGNNSLCRYSNLGICFKN